MRIWAFVWAGLVWPGLVWQYCIALQTTLPLTVCYEVVFWPCVRAAVMSGVVAGDKVSAGAWALGLIYVTQEVERRPSRAGRRK